MLYNYHNNDKKEQEQIMTELTYKIPSIHCEHCVHTIEMEIGDIQGVKSAKASLADKQLKVEFEHPATQEIIEGTLREINYPPEK
jgi:copper chaperone